MNEHKLVDRLAQLGRWERRVVERVLSRHTVARNTQAEFARELTFGQRVADKVAAFGGSWPFIFLFLGMMAFWITINAVRPRPFDPYPFILLNLFLSCLAALQAPVIMMSQNRQAAKDRLAAEHDYEVNLKAEVEILGLHTKLDELRDSRLEEVRTLLAAQQETLARLESELRRLRGRESQSNPGEL